MMRFLPQNIQHQAVFITSAACLALAQVHRMVYSPGVNGLDATMALMFNFCKVTSLVCSVRDGQTLLKLGQENSKLKKREIEYASTDGIPSFFDYWSYMYFCGASISGPFYEYKDF